MSALKKNTPVNKNLIQPLYVVSTNEKSGFLQTPYYSKKLKDANFPEKEFLEMVNKIREDERVKIGHELHDGVNPLLALAKFYLLRIPANTEKEKFDREQLTSIILSAITNIRSISSRLVVSQKTDYSLARMVSDLVEKTNAINLFKISFSHCKEQQLSKLSSQKKLVLYRIIQEQLNNIIKHSKADSVEIELCCKKASANLSVKDNGIGFDIINATRGIGLTNIATRVKQVNGVVKIKSTPGNGCALQVSIPF